MLIFRGAFITLFYQNFHFNPFWIEISWLERNYNKSPEAMVLMISARSNELKEPVSSVCTNKFKQKKYHEYSVVKINSCDCRYLSKSNRATCYFILYIFSLLELFFCFSKFMIILGFGLSRSTLIYNQFH